MSDEHHGQHRDCRECNRYRWDHKGEAIPAREVFGDGLDEAIVNTFKGDDNVMYVAVPYKYNSSDARRIVVGLKRMDEVGDRPRELAGLPVEYVSYKERPPGRIKFAGVLGDDGMLVPLDMDDDFDTLQRYQVALQTLAMDRGGLLTLTGEKIAKAEETSKRWFRHGAHVHMDDLEDGGIKIEIVNALTCTRHGADDAPAMPKDTPVQ